MDKGPCSKRVLLRDSLPSSDLQLVIYGAKGCKEDAVDLKSSFLPLLEGIRVLRTFRTWYSAFEEVFKVVVFEGIGDSAFLFREVRLALQFRNNG